MRKLFRPHLTVAFPGGTGTKDMIHVSLRAGVRVLSVAENGAITWEKAYDEKEA